MGWAISGFVKRLAGTFRGADQTAHILQLACPRFTNLLELASIEAVTEVLILTKPAAPFSFEYGTRDDILGYSIDMVEEIALRLFGSTATTTAEMMVDNNDILYNQISGLNSTRCNPVVNPQRVCIGAAAISVTSSRTAPSRPACATASTRQLCNSRGRRSRKRVRDLRKGTHHEAMPGSKRGCSQSPVSSALALAGLGGRLHPEEEALTSGAGAARPPRPGRRAAVCPAMAPQ